jgi:putative sterol carrier protein
MANETLILPQTPPTDQLPPELRDMRATYRFELEDGRTFMLRLDWGRLSAEEAAADADCILRCPMNQFIGALSGRLNLLTAFMRGDIHIQGDLELTKRLYRYLRIARTQEGHP